jgi:hypothetical protein
VKALGKLTHRLDSSITSLGTQTIDGVTANGYAASVDLASLLNHEQRVTPATSAKVLKPLGPSLPVEVWAEPRGPVEAELLVPGDPEGEGGITRIHSC